MQCNAMRCNAMQCNAMQCNAMQCNAINFKIFKLPFQMPMSPMHWVQPCVAMIKWHFPNKGREFPSMSPLVFVMSLTMSSWTTKIWPLQVKARLVTAAAAGPLQQARPHQLTQQLTAARWPAQNKHQLLLLIPSTQHCQVPLPAAVALQIVHLAPTFIRLPAVINSFGHHPSSMWRLRSRLHCGQKPLTSMQLHTTSEAVQFTKVRFDQFLFQ